MQNSGTLFIVATPIGNLQDITLRALETLKTVDLILAEDTRHTGQLLQHYTIHKPMLSFHEHNEHTRANEAIDKLLAGQSIALVSDAGTPLVSDPGYKLVRECISKGIKVESIPGPTAAIVALTVSGLPPDKFLFIGFLPEKQGKRQKLLQSLLHICHSERSSLRSEESCNASVQPLGSFVVPPQDDRSDLKTTIILYESPYHLKRTLEDIQSTLGNIPIVICRELTKLHEEVFRGTIEEALTHFLPADLPDLSADRQDGSQGRQGQNPKGEFVILL